MYLTGEACVRDMPAYIGTTQCKRLIQGPRKRTLRPSLPSVASAISAKSRAPESARQGRAPRAASGRPTGQQSQQERTRRRCETAHRPARRAQHQHAYQGVSSSFSLASGSRSI
eukprot:355810-Chlamydomonas_euryale.AAC.3